MSKPNRIRKLAATTALAGLSITVCASAAGVLGTDASWTAESSRTGSFSAAKLTAVENLKCFDSKNDGLLGTPLLTNQLLLAWTPPPGLENAAVKYKVSWNGGLLGPKGEAIVEDGSTSYLYKAALLGSILSFSLEFKITPVVGTWEGPSQSYTASAISALLSITMTC